MYIVIAYHGNGKGNGEVESDLKVLWRNLEQLAKIRKIEHIFYFQAIRDNVGADMLMVVEYHEDSLKHGFQHEGINPLGFHRVDYWLYIRNSRNLSGDTQNEREQKGGSK